MIPFQGIRVSAAPSQKCDYFAAFILPGGPEARNPALGPDVEKVKPRLSAEVATLLHRLVKHEAIKDRPIWTQISLNLKLMRKKLWWWLKLKLP